MSAPEPTSACVVLFEPHSRLVLVERHADGLGLPGGKREPTDPSSLACAARELYEETGVRLRSARSIVVYDAGPHLCEAWLAVSVDAYPTVWEVSVRNASWVYAEELVREGSRFPAYCALLFARLASARVGDLRCV